MQLKFQLYFTILLLSVLQSSQLNAQNYDESRKERVEKTKAAIKDLKSGALVVIMPTQSSKIKVLKEEMTNAQINESQRKRLEKILSETIVEQDSFIKKHLYELNTHYTFSKIYFIPDTLINRFKAGDRSSIFLNKNGKIDSNITMSENTHLFFRYGSTPSGQGLRNWWCLDAQFNVIPSPFPQHPLPNIAENKRFFLFQSLRAAGKDVKKMNNSFFRLHRIIEEKG